MTLSGLKGELVKSTIDPSGVYGRRVMAIQCWARSVENGFIADVQNTKSYRLVGNAFGLFKL